MVALLIAVQLIIAKLPAYHGPLPPIDASCRYVLMDQKGQKLDLVLHGDGDSRRAIARVNGRRRDATVEVSSSDGAAVTEVIIVTLDSGKRQYGLEYSGQALSPIQRSDIWAELPDGGLQFAGTGLCRARGATK